MADSEIIPLHPTSQSLIPIASDDNDDHLVDLFLRKQSSDHTRESYGRTIAEFRNFVGCNIKQITLDVLLTYTEWLPKEHENPKTHKLETWTLATQARKIASVKSLLTFAHETGYTPFNVGRAVRLPQPKNALAERILSEEDIFKLFMAAEEGRDRLLLRTLYVCGGRISEVVNASWRDLQPRSEGGQITLFGKRDKTRVVLLPEKLWRDLIDSRNGAEDSTPLFKSREGRLSRGQAWRIVKGVAKKAGVSWATSPHWLRHAHASHALENGATVALVSETLGHGSVAITSRYLHARPGESSSQHLKVG